MEKEKERQIYQKKSFGVREKALKAHMAKEVSRRGFGIRN